MIEYPSNQSTPQQILYRELVDRLYHIERAFIARRHIKLHYSNSVSAEISSQYLKVIKAYKEFFWSVEEAQLWFISVELYSRFLANSKKGLVALVESLKDETISSKLVSIGTTHAAVVGFIKTQRDKYLTHADDVEWKDFPNVFDKEYDNLLTDIKSIMAEIGKVLGSQRIPTTTTEINKETLALLEALLKQIVPDADVSKLSKQYEKDLQKFLSA